VLSILVIWSLHYLSWGSIYGERNDFLVKVLSSQLPPNAKLTISKSDPRFWVPLVLSKSLIDSFADLSEVDVSTKPDNWNADPAQYILVKGANLRLVSMRHANAYKAFLVNAQLQYADLTGALLFFAYLQHADLSICKYISRLPSKCSTAGCHS